MNVDQLVFVRHDTNVSPDTGGTFGSRARSRSAGQRAARRVRRRAPGPARARRRSRSGCRPRASASRGGVVSAAAGRSPTASCVGGRLLGVRCRRRSSLPAQAPAKPISAVSRSSGISRMPRLDIPAKVMGTYIYIHNVRVPGMLHGRLVRPLGQGAYGDGTLAGIVSVDERSIAGLGDARVVRRGDFARRRRLAGVRRDPGRVSAEGRLPRPAARSRAAGTCSRQMRDARRRRAGAGAHAGAARATSTRRSPAAAHTVARELRLPLPGPHADRPELRGRRRDRRPARSCSANTQDAYAMRDKLSALLGLPDEPDPGAVLGGCEHVRQQPGPLRRRRGGGGDVAARGRARAAPVHALGRARLGQLRPGHPRPTCAAVLTARATSSRSTTRPTASRRSRCASDATTQNAGIPLAPPGLGAADTINSGTQYAIPNRRVSAQVAAALGHVLQDLGAARARTARRPASPPSSSSTSSRTPPGSTRTSSGCRTSQTAQVNDGFGQWRDALNAVARARRLAAARRRLERLEARTIVRGRGIAIGGFASSQAAVVADDRGEPAHREDPAPPSLRSLRSRASPSTCPGSRTRSRAT